MKPAIPYFGAKTSVADEIAKVIDAEKPERYVEEFAGGLSVYFAKKPSPEEVINDIDPNITRFYKELKDGMDFEQCDMTPDRDKFKSLEKGALEGTLTPCEFLYRDKHAYAGKYKHNGYGNHKKCMDMEDPSKCMIVNNIKNQEEFSDRMRNTTIENADYRDIIKKYDSKSTVHYEDPPYFKHAKDYKVPEGPVAPKVVAEANKNLEGKAIISFDDSPEVREAFDDPQFRIMEICLPYTAQQTKNESYHQCKKELLITNFDTPCKWIDKEMRC